MPRPSNESEVTQSIFDRLIDHDPRNNAGDEYRTRAQSVRDLKNAVRRDLEWLLNSRRVAIPPDERLKEVNRSLYVYGLPDFTALSLSDPRDHNKLMRNLQSIIQIFEPRLLNPHIATMESSDSHSRTLRFRIEGLLRMDPSPEHVSFDTVLELTSGEYEVKGDADA
ncbi:MAG: type VI secretion system baseplate subunit TssE [Bryobacterales bacterium]|jgi:type VI secretion system protein ImpF|nr:type VI secretion system baseplate subunit TssE [Bryobacterales bacterium]